VSTEEPSEPARNAVAVVSGAASGFGAAIAARCAAHGMDVAVLDIDGDRAADVARDLTSRFGIAALADTVDVGVDADVVAAARRVGDELGGCDVLFANVGVQQFGAVLRLTDDDWSWVLNVNVIGAARTVRAFVPLMAGRPSPRISLTASSSVLAPTARLGAYQASKFAVLGLAETLRVELADLGIAVSTVFPSGMATRHLESSIAARPAELGASVTAPDDLEVMLSTSSFSDADFATPEEAALHVLEDVLNGERYIITHGALSEAFEERTHAMRRALDLVEARQATRTDTAVEPS
jgi:NAD(P)-dependent dehydrogenase (short-subunit alcohol dehydrogenase family)